MPVKCMFGGLLWRQAPVFAQVLNNWWRVTDGKEVCVWVAKKAHYNTCSTLSAVKIIVFLFLCKGIGLLLNKCLSHADDRDSLQTR